MLFDINAVLDLLLDRQPWASDVRKLAEAVLDGRVEGFVSAVSYGTIHYIISKQAGAQAAWICIDRCLATFKVAPADGGVIRSSIHLKGADYEDDLQIASAMAVRADLIVTRDRDGFAASQIPAVSAGEALARAQIK